MHFRGGPELSHGGKLKTRPRRHKNGERSRGRTGGGAHAIAFAAHARDGALSRRCAE